MFAFQYLLKMNQGNIYAIQLQDKQFPEQAAFNITIFIFFGLSQIN